MAVKKEFNHLIKPAIIRDAPEGLYAEPRIWMEAKDMEGFNAQFSWAPATLKPSSKNIGMASDLSPPNRRYLLRMG